MRSLWPREHGAYAQLGAPLLASLLLGEPTAPAIALAVGACLAFLANEPLLVVLGHRGARLGAALGPAARRRLAITAGGAAIAAGVGLAFGPPLALALAAVAALPVLVMLRFAWTKSMHSVGGELLAAIALPGAAAPVAAAAGIAWQTAALLWVAWSLGYAASVFAVHEVLRRQRRRLTGILLVALALALATVTALVPALGVSLPLAGISALVCVRPPAAKRVRAIGVALACASAASGVIAMLVAGATS